MMILEFNEVLIEGEEQTLSLMAKAGEVTCLTGANVGRRSRWLSTILGFVNVTHGYISIDCEPLTECSATFFRQFIAYAPASLEQIGEVTPYEPPSVQDVFSLKANRNLSISNGILSEEIRKVNVNAEDSRVRLLAVAVLLGRPILVVDNPPAGSGEYLKRQAHKNRIVIVASDEPSILEFSDHIVEI
jgi:ABC-type Mn2+/Zn2+ transport system ATPase subunit